MRATKFEFEQRFWVIGALIFIAFSLGSVDHVSFAVGLLRWIAPAIDHDSARGNFWLRLIFGSGALLIFLSALLRTWATAYLHTEVVHDVSQHSEALVADGPYRYVRNPLYLANLPMMAGIGVMASRLGWLFMVISVWLFVYRLIFREEDGLRQTQGESGGGQPRWGQAIAGEMIFWLFGVAVLCFAITLNIKLTGIVFAASFGFYLLVVGPLVKKRRTATGS
jgi:protein-S-isoprenylcysteine O-methyltransferase Ste14